MAGIEGGLRLLAAEFLDLVVREGRSLEAGELGGDLLVGGVLLHLEYGLEGFVVLVQLEVQVRAAVVEEESFLGVLDVQVIAVDLDGGLQEEYPELADLLRAEPDDVLVAPIEELHVGQFARHVPGAVDHLDSVNVLDVEALQVLLFLVALEPADLLRLRVDAEVPLAAGEDPVSVLVAPALQNGDRLELV